MSHMHPIRGVAAGVLAGLAASWVMSQFQELKAQNAPGRANADGADPKMEPQKHKEREEGSSDDEAATVKTAQLVSKRLFEHDLTPEEKQVGGPVVHYAFGAVVGGLYGGLAEVMPVIASGLGMPFGFALWALGDEVAVPALGLSKPPTEYGPEVHADALAAHFMYGATTDMLRRVIKHII